MLAWRNWRDSSLVGKVIETVRGRMGVLSSCLSSAVEKVDEGQSLMSAISYYVCMERVLVQYWSSIPTQYIIPHNLAVLTSEVLDLGVFIASLSSLVTPTWFGWMFPKSERVSWSRNTIKNMKMMYCGTHTHTRIHTFTVKHTHSSSCSLSSSTLTVEDHILSCCFVFFCSCWESLPRKLGHRTTTSSLLLRSIFLHSTITVPKLTSMGVPNILENFASPI